MYIGVIFDLILVISCTPVKLVGKSFYGLITTLYFCSDSNIRQLFDLYWSKKY